MMNRGLAVPALGWVLLAAASDQALCQVSMVSSPVNGNPANIAVSFDGTSVGQVVLQIHPNPGQQGGSCYAMIQRHLFGVRVKLYDTAQGYPDSFVYGDLGWNDVLNSNACKVNLALSSRPDYYTYILNIEMLPTVAGNNQVVSFWEERTCNPWCSWGWSQSYTIGTWNSGGAGGGGPQMQSPAPGIALPAAAVTFQWTASPGATAYWLQVGDGPGLSNFANVQTASTQLLVANLPTDGRGLWVKLRWLSGGVWSERDYTYAAANFATAAVLISPANGSQLQGGTNLTFQWSAGNFITGYSLTVGTSPGAGDILNDARLLSRSITVLIPSGTQNVYVTLGSSTSGGWLRLPYSFRVNSPDLPNSPGELTAPVPGSVLEFNQFTFFWTPGTNAQGYRILVGEKPGSNDYLITANIPAGTTSYSVPSIPLNGAPLFVDLLTKFSDKDWSVKSYRFERKAGSGAPPGTQPAQLISPVPGSVLPASGFTSAVTFGWSGGAGASEYWLKVGTTPGGYNLYDSMGEAITNYQVTVGPIPKPAGGQIYVTLYSRIGGSWYSNSYTYQAPPIDPPSVLASTDNFLRCITDPNYAPGAIDRFTCTLPKRQYWFWNEAPAGVSTDLGIAFNRQWAVKRSGITIQGDPSQRPQLIRHKGCEPLFVVDRGLTNVKIQDLEVYGSNGALTGTCMGVAGLEGTPPAQTPVLQPVFAVDTRISEYSSTSSAATSNIRWERVQFRDAIGKALVINGYNTSAVTVTGSTFRNAGLAGAVVWDKDLEVYAACVPPGSTYPWSIVTRAVTFDGNFFARNWTGALTLSSGVGHVVKNSYFLDNYWRPYDEASGTIDLEPCVSETNIDANLFEAANVWEDRDTTAIEDHSRGGSGNEAADAQLPLTKLTGNQILDYPGPGISLNSVVGHEISGNIIKDNSRTQSHGDGGDPPGILIWNRAGRRNTEALSFVNNTVNNSPGLDRQGYGIKLARCPDSACSSGSPQVPIDPSSNNTLSPNRLGLACFEIGVLQPSLQWTQCAQ